ncbi:MAG: alpha/beta hydrolase [Lutimonas sp.]
MSAKTSIYLIPGLGAGSEIFEYLKLPEDRVIIHRLEWLIPESEQESLENYALRMTAFIKDEMPILIGVSFGGLLAQEISKLIPVKKVIIISSLKKRSELPRRLKLLQTLGLYKMLPTRRISRIDDFSRFNFHQTVKRKAELYNRYMRVRNEKYLNWAIKSVLHWKGDGDISNLVHIHGTRDEIFPIKYIENCIPVENGTHAMIITKAKKISQIIINSLET